MTTVYFTNNQKRQVVDFLKKYACIIYVNNCLECEFQKSVLEQNHKYQCIIPTQFFIFMKNLHNLASYFNK